jgi:hypothetical protein
MYGESLQEGLALKNRGKCHGDKMRYMPCDLRGLESLSNSQYGVGIYAL